MLNIAIVGGIWNEEQREHVDVFCQALGQEIATRGHTLLGGAQTELDKLIAAAARSATCWWRRASSMRRLTHTVLP
jgi:hypothetical protein